MDPRDLSALRILWAEWQQHPPTADPSAYRIWARYVCLDPDDPGWSGWMMMATIAGGAVQLTMPETDPAWRDEMQAAIDRGESLWTTIPGDGLCVQCVRYGGDGPPSQDQALTITAPWNTDHAR